MNFQNDTMVNCFEVQLNQDMSNIWCIAFLVDKHTIAHHLRSPVRGNQPGQHKNKMQPAFLSTCDKLHDANNQENKHMFKRGRSSILT